jgi:hypothetical protein
VALLDSYHQALAHALGNWKITNQAALSNFFLLDTRSLNQLKTCYDSGESNLRETFASEI